MGMPEGKFLTLRRNLQLFDLPVERREADLERLRGELFVVVIGPQDVGDVLPLEIVDRLLHRPGPSNEYTASVR